jgi:CRP-like cAMP-binding protein
MTVNPADYLVHFSNVLLLISYSVRDMLWLRWFAVAAAITNIPYFLLQADVLWPPVLWATVFTGINLVQIARLYLARRPVILSGDEQALYDMGFHSLRPREFISLLLAGAWRDFAAGDTLLTEGTAVASVCIPIRGNVSVSRGGRPVATLPPGKIIGTALALSGDPSPVTATMAEPGRGVCWRLHDLRAFLDRRPDLRVAMQGFVSRDLAAKVEQLVTR